MKKILIAAFAAAMMIPAFTSCGNKTAAEADSTPAPETATVTDSATPEAAAPADSIAPAKEEAAPAADWSGSWKDGNAKFSFTKKDDGSYSGTVTYSAGTRYEQVDVIKGTVTDDGNLKCKRVKIKKFSNYSEPFEIRSFTLVKKGEGKCKMTKVKAYGSDGTLL